MPPSVGLLGAGGYMGLPLLRGLEAASQRGELKLVILHRPSSDLSRFPKSIEKRVVDLAMGSPEDIRKAVTGLQVIISAIAGRSVAFQKKPEDPQLRLIDALQGSRELITFVASDWATPILPEVAVLATMGPAQNKRRIMDYARTKGVPCTMIANATTPELLFEKSFSSFKTKENSVQLFVPRGNAQRGLTSKRFTGDAMAHLLRQRLHDLPDKIYSFVELQFGAQQIIDEFTRLHKQKPHIEEYTQEDFTKDAHRDFLGALKASGLKSLATGVEWPGEVISDFPGWQSKTLGDYISMSLESPGSDP